MAVKTAVVTGGTTRVGAAIAARLRADGWRVLTTSHRADAGADIVADFRAPGGAVGAYAAALRLLDGQPPAALVNNAALFTGSDADLEAVNFIAPQKLTMLMAGREDGVGAVVNILDAAVGDGTAADEPHRAYAETKRRLRADTAKAAEMFAVTLRVNAVSPGPVLAPTDVREKAGDCPLGRPTAGQVADAVAFLLGNGAVTGVDLPVDGGRRFSNG